MPVFGEIGSFHTDMGVSPWGNNIQPKADAEVTESGCTLSPTGWIGPDYNILKQITFEMPYIPNDLGIEPYREEGFGRED